MVGTLLLAAAIASPLPDFDSAIRSVVDALRRKDPTVTAADPANYQFGAMGEIIEGHDEITVHSFRLAAVEEGEEATLLLVEMDVSAVILGSRRPVKLPRWWSIDVRRAEGGWSLISAVTLERRVASQFLHAPRDQLSAALARDDIDPERFLSQVAFTAADGPDGCNALLWALETSRARGFWVSEAGALQTLSYLTITEPEAELAAKQSLRLGELAGDPGVIADSRFSLGIAYWYTDRIDEAVESLRAAGDLAEAAEDPRFAMRAQYMAYVLELRRQRLREALAQADRLEELATRFPTPHSRADAAMALGVIHSRLGNIAIARRQFSIALEGARETRYQRGAAIALANLAVLALAAGEHATGRELLQETLAIGAKRLGPADLGVVRQRYARLQLDDGDFDGAEETVAAVLAAAGKVDERSLRSWALALRAELRLMQGRVPDALTDAREARRVADSGEGFGRAELDNPVLAATTVEGRALRANRQPDAAEAVLRAAIDLAEAELVEEAVDETGSVAVAEKKLEPYRALLDLFVEQQCPREALLVAERMRARSLRDVLRNGRVDLVAGIDPALQQQEHALERQLVAANRALLNTADEETRTRLTLQRNDARLALRRFRSQLQLARTDPRSRRPETFDDYADWHPAVEPDEVVLEMVVTPASTWVFALHHEGGTLAIDVHRVDVESAVLEKRVNAFVGAVENRDFSYRREAAALHELLLGPVARRIASSKRLRIVPDGVLWRLPFHVLIDRRGRPLAERVSCSYSPSLAPRRDHASRAPRGLFALGDPSTGSATASVARAFHRDLLLGALPDAAIEARAIARLYDDAQVRVGAEASESAFKSEAGNFRVLHLAAHSIVDDGAPMFSSIVLTTSGGDPLEDGLLEAREVADLKLRADIAVLSGCETARGKVTPGEGMIGLSWAFLVAGVPTTVVSQWKVGSDTTAILMVAFHRRLRDGAAPAEALRGAMLEMRRDPRWRHPYYWAPFVVVENGPS